MVLDEPQEKIQSFLDLYHSITHTDVLEAIDDTENHESIDPSATVLFLIFDPSLKEKLFDTGLYEEIIDDYHFDDAEVYDSFFGPPVQAALLFPHKPPDPRINDDYYRRLMHAIQTRDTYTKCHLELAVTLKILFPDRFSLEEIEEDIAIAYVEETSTTFRDFDSVRTNVLRRLLDPDFTPPQSLLNQLVKVIENDRNLTEVKWSADTLFATKILAAEKVLVQGNSIEVIMPDPLKLPQTKPLPMVRSF